MDLRLFLLFTLNAYATATATSFKSLFPQQNMLYEYSLRANVTTGTVSPIEDGSFWTLEGRLVVQTHDDFARLRMQLGNLKTLTGTKEGTTADQSQESLDHLQTPFEISICFSTIHVYEEPVWVTNIKRALAFNFLVNVGKGPLNSIEEPCLYGYCVSVYASAGMRTRKYSGGATRARTASPFERCGPARARPGVGAGRGDDSPHYLMTAERDYYLDESVGLKRMEMKSDFQYKTHDHILSVTTQLTLTQEGCIPVNSITKLNLTESAIQYAFHNYSNPSNGIWKTTLGELKNKTYETLLKIARKGIDADNIVRNASLIHSLDFIELLNLLSQLDYESMTKLFEDVLGTSYELETARNIFLEVLPYVRTEVGAKMIRYLVVDQKSKIEDSMLLSLIRKLPYSIAEHSRQLLEELEIFTKLGLDYPQEIRHAGILSFATLASRVMETNFDQNYFDDVYDKYLRMYNYCPQYVDRLVWLQGLANIGKNNINYLDEIYTNTHKDRHERVWAALASLNIWKNANLENTLIILMNETEHIQLRAVALHAILSSSLGPRDFFNVHNYIRNCDNDQLKKFYFSTMKSLGSNRFYDKYKFASYYIPFLAAQLRSPELKDWATNNIIISQEPTLDIQGPTFQLLTVGGAWSGPPELIMLEFSTGGELAFNGAVYIIAEGVTSNLFRRLQKLNYTTEKTTDELFQILQELQVHFVEPDQVHIDIIVKVKDTTIYATHVNQEKFNEWNAEDVRKSIEDFVRFGSHINQQMVYYPSQVLKDFPTELGTPVRLQSTLLSFTSIRGNLTAPSTDDLTWRNDLHVRYQGTAMTSLSTDGPLHPSLHVARIQQSMVAHLPTKFDVRYSPREQSLELTWTNPSQNGGIAMHSRTQVSIVTRNGVKTDTVSSKGVHDKNDGIFFDCENPMTKSQISEHLRSRNNNIMSSLHPAPLILNSIRLITSPTAGSCGVILPPVQLPTAHQLRVGIECKDRKTVQMYFKETDENKVNFLLIHGLLELNGNGRNAGQAQAFIDIQSLMHGNVSICLSAKHESLPFNADFTDDPAAYKGAFTLLTAADCDAEDSGSKLELHYENQPYNEVDRDFHIRARGRHFPYLNWNDLNIFGYSDTAQLLNKLTNHFEDEYDNYVTIKQENGETWVNGERAGMSWLPPSSTPLQLMKKLGFYHECRVKTTEVYDNQLVIGDCTDKPRFAVILLNLEDNNVVVYSTKNSVSFHASPNVSSKYKLVTSDQEMYNNDLSITSKGAEHILHSKLTGVIVYHRPNETVVLVPQPYMNTACGSCVGL